MRPTVLFPRFIRCKRGTAALESAFILPVFFFLILGMFELGLMAYSSVTLDTIVQRAGRDASIGRLQGTGTHSARAIAVIKEGAKKLVGGSMAQVTARTLSVTQEDGYSGAPDFCRDTPGDPYPDTCNNWLERNSVPNPNPNAGNGNGEYNPGRDFGGAREVVEIRLTLPWRANFGLVRDIFGEDGVLLLESSTIVKNEPQ